MKSSLKRFILFQFLLLIILPVIPSSAQIKCNPNPEFSFQPSGGGDGGDNGTLCEQFGGLAPTQIWGQFGAATLASTLPLTYYSGDVIYLQGDLVVDIDLQLVSCIILIAPNRKIVIEDGWWLDLSDSKLFACNEMWQGIIVNNNCGLFLTNTHIEDAWTAVEEAGENSFLYLLNAVFNRNHEGINSEKPGTLNWFLFENARFTCTSNLNPPLNGIDRSYFAINITNKTGTIGMDVFNLGYNLFSRQNLGISATSSFFTVQNCKFSECDFGITLHTGIMTQVGLGGDASSEPSFENCNYGITAFGYSLDVSKNNFVNNSIDIRTSGQIFFGGGVKIDKNRFFYDLPDPGWVSIEFAHEFSFSDEITFNHFENYGILQSAIFTLPTYSSQSLDVSHNQLTIGGDGHTFVGYELQLENVTGNFSFTANTANYYSSNLSTRNAFLHVHDLNMPNVVGDVSHNEFFGDNLNLEKMGRAIEVFNSKANFCDNLITHSRTGVEIHGECIGENMFSETHFGVHATGLLIDGGAQIGKQEIKGNDWLENSNYSSFAAKNNSDPNLSQIIVDPTIPSHFPNGSINPTIGWFDPRGDGENSCTSVYPPPLVGSLQEATNTDLGIADGSVFSSSNSIEAWEAKKYLFLKILAYPGILNKGVSFSNFYNQEHNNPVGQFARVKHQMGASFIIPPTLQEGLVELSATINSGLIQLKNIDAALALDRDNQELRDQKSSLIASIHAAKSEQQSLIQVHRQNSLQSLELALQANSEIVATTSYEINEQELNDVKLGRLLSQDSVFSEADLMRIRAIAYQCPETGGSIVYTARAMLPPCEAMELSLNPPMCPENYPRIIPNGNSSVLDLEVFPNPTKGSITIAIPEKEEIECIKIFNTYGECVRIIKIEDGMTGLKIENLPVGAYFLNASQKTGNTSIKKIIIY